MPVKLAKGRPPVVRPFLHKYMGPKVYQKRPWRTGFIPWWHPRVKKFVWNWLYLRLCFAKLCNCSLEICYFLEIFLVGCCIFPVTKAKSWPQTPEELASLEIGESEATQYV